MILITTPLIHLKDILVDTVAQGIVFITKAPHVILDIF